MGEGYRIIAKSAGVKANEAAELPQRAPSHGGLCDKSPDAHGMIALLLESGRYAIGFCRHAGREHTARGGHRVHTHFVFVDESQYGAFDCDPWEIANAIAAADGDAPMLKARPSLEPISLLRVANTAYQSAIQSNPGAALSLIRRLLSDDKIVVDANNLTTDLIRIAWRLTPAFRRRTIGSISTGVNFAPARKLTASFITGDTTNTRSLLAERPERWLTINGGDQADGFQPSMWIAHIENSIADENTEEAVELCDELTHEFTAKELDKTVSFFTVVEEIAVADRSQLARIELSLAAFTPKSPTQHRLVNEGLAAVARRSGELSELEKKAAEEADENSPVESGETVNFS